MAVQHRVCARLDRRPPLSDDVRVNQPTAIRLSMLMRFGWLHDRYPLTLHRRVGQSRNKVHAPFHTPVDRRVVVAGIRKVHGAVGRQMRNVVIHYKK